MENNKDLNKGAIPYSKCAASQLWDLPFGFVPKTMEYIPETYRYKGMYHGQEATVEIIGGKATILNKAGEEIV